MPPPVDPTTHADTVALFRYGLIADLLYLPAGDRSLHARLREKATREYDTIPEDAPPEREDGHVVIEEVRESIKVQAFLAEIGSRMGMQLWIPKSDRGGVLHEWRGDHPPILDRLPLNYDDTTLRTIEQIDVLWLKGRAIKRAFEVECHDVNLFWNPADG